MLILKGMIFESNEHTSKTKHILNGKISVQEYLVSTTLICLWHGYAFANSAAPNQLAKEVVKYVNFHQQPESSNRICWKLELGVAFYFLRHGKG